MNQHWRKQQPDTPLFPDIEWNKPERRDLAGRLGIIGGNKLGFAAAADAYEIAKKTGAGEVRVLLPDALRSKVPTQMTDVLFAPTNASGSLASEAATDVAALHNWATGLLYIGDAGKNSQTAIPANRDQSSATQRVKSRNNLIRTVFVRAVGHGIGKRVPLVRGAQHRPAQTQHDPVHVLNPQNTIFQWVTQQSMGTIFDPDHFPT